MARALATARARGIVLVAAAGNLGDKSPPQYPAADPNVIAVIGDRRRGQAVQGFEPRQHIAVAAPGVDILVPVAGRQLRRHLGHLVRGRPCQRRRLR